MMERFYILGHPVAHSKSPAMYNALYQELGFDWEYGFMDCETVDQARTFIQSRDFLGINITMPYKVLAMECADLCAATVRLAGGANVLIRKEDKLIAYNVDGEGCIKFLEDQGITFKGKTVVVCGTGPTSLSILYAASFAGAAKITLLGRSKEKSGTILLESLDKLHDLAYGPVGLPAPHPEWRTLKESYEKTDFSYGSYGVSKKAIQESDVIIDATPLGMQPGDEAPFDTELLNSDQIVFDVVYGQGQTKLIKAAQDLGCRTFDGAGMLVSQAVSTALIQGEINNNKIPLSRTEIFDLMAKAANFTF